ncbi:MAG: GNAT family N-acetyltransferase [Acidobacteriota bacterium]
MGLAEGPTIRRATTDDARALTEIAHQAKRHWGYPERWIEIWKDALTITTDFILIHEVHVACVDGKIAGFSAVVRANDKVWLEHLWVLPEHIGTGLGKMLFTHAARVAASTGAPALEIESDPNAEGFYRLMGSTRVGEVVSEIEGEKRVLPLLTFDLSQHHDLNVFSA